MITHPVIKAGMDITSVSAIFSWWVGVLPTVVGFLATLASLGWYSYCLYEAIQKKRKNN